MVIVKYTTNNLLKEFGRLTMKIKILSITEGKEMLGLLSIDPKSSGTLFKFLYVEE